MIAKAISKIKDEQLKKDVPSFKIGDGVKVFVRIKEGNKERVQAFIGTVIARDGHGSTETFTVRRIAFGVGIEKVFPVHSPFIQKIEVDRSAKVRRAKLYFLRDRNGRQARLKEVRA
ncbi:MAG: 50S ribosomal protein L19 [Kiritimatiellia bacterium]